MALNSSAVTAGTNATAVQYNNLRSDALRRLVRFVFQIKGALAVENDAGNAYLLPVNMTVVGIKHKLEAGSATIRLKSGSNTIKSSISVTTSVATETSSFTTTALVADERLQLDITGATNAEDLTVILLCEETLS